MELGAPVEGVFCGEPGRAQAARDWFTASRRSDLRGSSTSTSRSVVGFALVRTEHEPRSENVKVNVQRGVRMKPLLNSLLAVAVLVLLPSLRSRRTEPPCRAPRSRSRRHRAGEREGGEGRRQFRFLGRARVGAQRRLFDLQRHPRERDQQVESRRRQGLCVPGQERVHRAQTRPASAGNRRTRRARRST